MGLRAQFNLAILAALLIGYAGAGLLLHSLFVSNARNAVLENARVMMRSANAVQLYIEHQVIPITGNEQNGQFLSATVPFYAAKVTFQALHQEFPDYALAEVALNPTNKEDQPADWQADIINNFRSNPDLVEQTSARETPEGAALALAEPIAVSDGSCLSCHSSSAIAPASMVAQYGPDNGFGWHLHEIVGAQIVTVPMALPLAQANAAFEIFMGTLAWLFLIVLLILNLLLHYIVIKPVEKVSSIANAVSLGQMDAEEYLKPGRDEISSLSASFNRMRRSLDTAMRMLGT